MNQKKDQQDQQDQVINEVNSDDNDEDLNEDCLYDNDKQTNNKNKNKDQSLIKNKQEQQLQQQSTNVNVLDKENNFNVELGLEKKQSQKKLQSHIPSSFQKNYNSEIGLWKYLNFMYAFEPLKKFVDQGKMPHLHDFPYPLKNENIDHYSQILSEIWDNIVDKRTRGNKQITGEHLRKAIRIKFNRGLIKCGLLGLFDSLLKIIQCVTMGLVMKMIQGRNLTEPIYYSSLYWITNISILFISLVIGTYCKTWFFHYSFELASKIRFSLIALIYAKVQELNVSVFSFEIQPGRIINMCANDLNDLDYGLSWVFQLLILPINLFLSTLIIYYYLGMYCIVGVTTLIIFIGLQEYYTNKVSQPLQIKNKQTDLRINLVKQFITHIKILKMYSWDRLFQSQIMSVRNQELDLTRKVMESIGIARSISNSSVLLSAFLMCVLYHYFSNGNLTYEKVFSSLSILNVVKSSLGYFSCSRGWLANINLLSDRVAQVILSKKKISITNNNLNNSNSDKPHTFLDLPISPKGQSKNIQNKSHKKQSLQNNKNNNNNSIQKTSIQDNQEKYDQFKNKSNICINSEKQKQTILKTDIEMMRTDECLPTLQQTEGNEILNTDQQPINYDNQNDRNNKNNNINQNNHYFNNNLKKQQEQQQQKQIELQSKKKKQKDWKYDEIYKKEQNKNQDNINEQSIKQSYQANSLKNEQNQLFSIKENKYSKSESEKDSSNSHHDDSSSQHSGSDEGKQKSVQKTYLKLSNFDAFWDQNIASLENVNLYLTNSFKFVQIIGKSGSGKSTLLLSILQEISNHTGQIEISGKISYVPQESVIYTGTIKHNILFGSQYDYIRYSHVKALCNLNEDIDKLPKKDDTFLQEGGQILSGGQRMRVNLARALYSRSQIILLDDPLAALDPKVSERIFKKMFKTQFLNGRLVLMSSHQLQYSQEADYILILENGKVAQQGTYNELQQIITELQYNEQKEREKNEAIMQEYKEYQNELQLNIYSTSSNNNSMSASFKIDSHDSSDIDAGNEEALKNMEVLKDINAIQGYKNYIMNMGGISEIILLIALYISIELSYIFFSTYFAHLATNTSSSDETILISGLFALLYLVLDLIKTLYFYKLNHHVSKQLHQKMLDCVTSAQMKFFAGNTIGNIINRFSNDVGVIDKTLPACLLDLIRGLVSNLILIITVCIFNLPLVSVSVLILAGLVYTRKQFSAIISISKQADLNSRSPIFNLLAETMTNLTLIRVFNQQNRFKDNFLRSIYDNTRAFYSMSKNQRMFDLILEMIIAVMIVVGISYILISLFAFNVGGSSVTLSIYFLINLGQGFSYAVRQTLAVDINMLSTSRICEYTTIEPEQIVQSTHSSQEQQQDNNNNNNNNNNVIIANKIGNFQPRGEIIFKNINLRYPNDIKLTLKKLSFSIKSGEKIGVVGRTGAGKSSLINALFRLYPIEQTSDSDSSITIDQINILDIPLPILRNAISIIPQEPVIFQGNTRFNLDPEMKYSEKELLDVLKEVGLDNKITSLDDDLQSLSVGEKQLICLARAFLKNTSILILDEMTANLDKTIDEFIQDKVRTLFKNKTIIAIAHRLISIADYDKILVLENGYLKDFDHPYLLLVEKEQDTKITKKNIFAGLVKNTGKETARKIMHKSREAYYQSKFQKQQQQQQLQVEKQQQNFFQQNSNMQQNKKQNNSYHKKQQSPKNKEINNEQQQYTTDQVLKMKKFTSQCNEIGE